MADKDINSIIFVSDCDLNAIPEVYDNVKTLTTITSYSALFVNRNIDDLALRNIHKIWINIREKDALSWLKLNVLSKKDRAFNVFCLYRQAGGPDQRWITQCAPDVSVEYELLANVKALNFEDFVNDLKAQSVNISKPLAHKCLGFLFSDRVAKN